ncbi:MAG: hypothetical protein P8Z36_10860 [Gemmatimonadota bacterium]
MIRTAPLAEAGEAELLEDESVDGVLEEDLREGVLSVVVIEELADGVIGEGEELVASKRSLMLLDLFFDPVEVQLSGGAWRRVHWRNVRGRRMEEQGP